MSTDNQRFPENPNTKKREILAEKRTTFARGRSFYAVERTFAAWIRTGFAISGAGVTLGKALQNSDSSDWALIMGGILIVMGIFTFGFAYYEYLESYRFINRVYESFDEPIQNFKNNIIAATILIFTLIIVSIMGFVLIII